MTVTSTLHLNFDGHARAALEYYHSVFGGDLVVVPYGDTSPDQADQVVWGQVSSPDGFHVMAYDVQHDLERDAGRNAFYFSLRSTDADAITGYWTALAAGSTVEVELGPSVFSPLYGKLTDRFGVVWIIDVMVPYGG
ncbi:VOC family protein [Rhodococcus sp. MEB041]|uniref:VOC family protein n=1 Tax=Rhodococcus sp. MEB041 TaxID=3040323 RepID=UPI00254BF7BD|nr:VOC family protein [Rhodococcus sp. MEB041]